MLGRRKFLQLAAGSLGAGALPSHGQAQSPDRFKVPAEDAPHEATFMQWPSTLSIYGDSWFLRETQASIALIANTIADFEPLILLADRAHHAQIRRQVGANVTLWDMATQDLWCRDSGPLVARDPSGQRAVVGIQFNGWGGKQVHDLDARIARAVADSLDFPYLETGLVGEGGGVEQDGHGTLLAHESSWINRNRNPGMTKAEVSRRLEQAYGASHVIWAPGLAGQDITDYHIDSLARFTGPSRVLVNLPRDPDPYDPFHRAAQKTVATLKAADLNLTQIYEPVYRRVRSYDFVASYVNYYVCNGALLVAEFGDTDMDTAAVAAVRAAYPGREIVPLNVDILGELGGGIHCATQQLIA